MKKNFLLLFFFIYAYTSFAQLNAEFTANRTSGCSPFIVNFTDISTPANSIITRKWYFGNGNSSSVMNPQASYGEPGTYNVTLIVSDGVNFDTIVKTNFITVYHDPLPDFTTTSPRSGCRPLKIFFQDSTQLAEANIVFWEWDFGDGFTSNTQNPDHKYMISGTFPVSIHVIDGNGCSNALLKQNYVNVSETPVPVFSSSETHHCSVPFNADFTNSSTGISPLTYSWNFGDTTFSALLNPSHNYTHFGLYDVQLVVADANGCTDTLTKDNFVQILNVNARFNVANNTVCFGKSIHFNNISTNANTYSWNFGDGTTTSVQNPNHTYADSGRYIVNLTASISGENCTSTYIDTVFVDKVIASYTRTPWYNCNLPATVQYTDHSINAVTWNWHFGNFFSDTSQNPVNIFNLSGKYYDTLYVSSIHGCKDTIVDSIIVKEPKAYFKTSTNNIMLSDKGCAPLTVFFTDSTNYYTPYDNITSWNWNFGDGNTSSLQNCVHLFQSSGNYFTELTITTALGCSESYGDTIHAGVKPVADFTEDTNLVCASTSVHFMDLSFDSTKVNEWQWYFNDTIFSFIKNPIKFFKDTGLFDIRLIAGYNGCYDTLTKFDYLRVLGPVTKIVTQFTCDNPLKYDFFGNIKAATKWKWDFDDGSVDSINVNPIHIFSAPGNYLVKLNSWNNTTGCPYYDSLWVFVRKPVAAFITDTTIGCPGLKVKFKGESSQDNDVIGYHNDFGKYLWNFNDGIQFGSQNLPDTVTWDSIYHVFNHKGTFHVRLLIQANNGCLDSTFKTIKVYQPEVKFTTAGNPVGCSPLNVLFIDQTTNDTLLSRWNWNLNVAINSTTQNPSYTYIIPANYNVSLHVVDTLGCFSDLTKPNFISVNQIIPKFLATDTTFCNGDTVHFINSTIGDSLNFLWNFGDGNTSTLKEPFYIYPDSGKFSVSLMVTDTVGCDSALIRTEYISVQKIPDANFYADTLDANCYPLLVKYTDSTNSVYTNQWNWNFGDGASSTLKNPEHIYTRPGLYSVLLAVSTSFGCRDTVTKAGYINVKGPYAEFSISGDVVCKGSTVMLKIDTMIDVFSFSWDFGDGAPIVTGNIDSVYHIYTDVGKLYPQLIYGDTANQCPQFIRDSVIINFVLAKFHIADTLSCAQSGVNFINESMGETYYDWSFGDGGTSVLTNPAHTFNSAGTFNVILIVSDENTCKDTAYKSVVVNALPQINSINDTIICPGDSIIINAGSGYNAYLWSGGSTDSIKLITGAEIITIKVQNNVGCWTNPDTVTITGVPFPAPNLGNDTNLCINTTIQLNPHGTIWDSFLWNDNSNANTLIVDTAGKYFVNISNVCGTVSDTVIIIELFRPVVNLGNDTVICNGTTITLNAQGFPYDQYVWIDSTITPILVVNSGGIYSVTVTNICASTSDSIQILQRFNPAVNLGNDTLVCEGTAIPLIASGYPYDSYLWNNDSAYSGMLADTLGIYSVTVSNICGNATDSILITEVYLPHVNLGNDTVICDGTLITISAQADMSYSYQWQDNSTNQTLLVDTGGFYSVTITNICTSTNDSIQIYQRFHPTVNLGNDTLVCEGTVIALNASGYPYDSYLWNNDSAYSGMLADTLGIYSVTVSNICGDATDSILITEVYLPHVNLGNDTVICPGTNIVLDAGVGYDSYLWQDGTTSEVMIADSAGKYHVLISNICATANDTLNLDIVPQASINLGVDTAICENSLLILNVHGTMYDSYFWQDGSIDSVFVIDTVGVYSVLVTNKCSQASDTINISEILLPTVDIGKDTAICYGTNIILNAGSGNNSYLWQNGDTNQIFTTNSDTLYFVSVANKCGNTHDSLHLKFLPVQVYLNNDTTICENTNIILFASSGFDHYLWQNGDTTQSRIVNSAGVYYVQATNKCGEVKDSIRISIIPLPVTNLGKDTAFSLGITILDAKNPGATYLWSDGSTQQTFIIPENTHTVWVQVTKNGCSTIDTIRILDYLPGGECTIELPTAFSPNGDGINDVLYMRGYCIDEVHFIIFNRYGQKVFETTNHNIGWDGTFKGEKQETEVYVYYLFTKFIDGKAVVKKGNVTLLN